MVSPRLRVQARTIGSSLELVTASLSHAHMRDKMEKAAGSSSSRRERDGVYEDVGSNSAVNKRAGIAHA
jgi:hypothetical protein